MNIGTLTTVAENTVICTFYWQGGGNTGYLISMMNIKCQSAVGYIVMEIALCPPMTSMESRGGL